jgi:hypothetical protein
LKAARYGRRNIPKIPRRNGSFLARPANQRLADLGVCARLQPDPARHLHDRLFRIAISDGLIAATARNRLFHEPARQHTAEKAILGGREVPFYGWHDPAVPTISSCSRSRVPGAARAEMRVSRFEISLLAAAWLVPLAARHRRRHRHTLRPYRAARDAWIHLAGAARDHAVANQTQRVAQA